MQNWLIKMALSYAKARLKEPSTWRGIIAMITGAGIALSPTMQNEILTIGLLLFGGAGALTPDVLGVKNGQPTSGPSGDSSADKPLMGAGS